MGEGVPDLITVWQLEIEITIPFKIYFQLETGYLKFNAKVNPIPSSLLKMLDLYFEKVGMQSEPL